MSIRFHIDKQESNQSGCLAIRTSHPFSLEMIKRLSSNDQQEPLLLLCEQELAYNRKLRSRIIIGGMTPLSLFHVPYSRVIDILKSLATTGELFFGEEKLLCDFFSKSELYFLTSANSSSELSIRGRIKANGKEFDLTDCDFICGGHPLLYIKDSYLKCIGTEIGWKDLKQLYMDPKSVSIVKLKEAYDDSDPEHPQFICHEDAEELIKSATKPQPLLILKERTGAFADLWMEYPSPIEAIRIPCHNPATAIRDRKGRVQVRRDLSSEGEWERDLLETDFIKKIVGTTHYYCPVDCVAKSLTFLLEIGWQIEDWEGRKVYRQMNTELEIETEPHAVLIKGKIKYGEHTANLQDVMGAFNKKDRFVQLGIGAVGLLPQKIDHPGLLSVAEAGEITPRGICVKRNHFGCLIDLLEAKEKIACDESFLYLRDKLLAFEGIEHAPPSAAFRGTLRPYQQQGVSWLNFLYTYGFHGLLADDMGLGKTVQVLAFLSRLSTTHPILIVLPTSLIFNWKREIEKFLPTEKLLVHHGQQRSKGIEEIQAAKIILTSYTTLRIDLPLFQKQFYECIILDEAQTIKNASTQSAKTLYQLKSRFRLSLTGTPIENHPGELWAHFRFLIPDLFGDEQAFLADTTAALSDFRYMQKIRKKIKPFLLRRQKQEVAADLPERIEQVVWVEMSAEQKQVYEDFLAGFKGNLFKKVEVDGIGKHRMEVLEAILRLRQICCHPQLAIETTAPSAKMEAVLEDIAVAIDEGRKILLYSQFTSMLGLLAKEVKNRGWPFAYLDGATTNREKVVQKFMEEKEVQLFLISLKAGGIGLNLTAADYVFLYDPWWNDAVENQAIDRAHRIGRKDTVIAKRYIALESIEEKMMKLKANKKSLISDIMHEEELVNTNLSIDDLRFLLT